MFSLGCQRCGLFYYIVLRTKRISAGSWLWQHKGKEVVRMWPMFALISRCTVTLSLIAGFFILKKVRQGMCLLAFIPSQLHADEQWDFNNVKLRPGNLTSKLCNLLCFDSVKPHRFNFVYNMFLSRKQIKKSYILLTMYTWTLFYWECIVSQYFLYEAFQKVHFCSILTWYWSPHLFIVTEPEIFYWLITFFH